MGGSNFYKIHGFDVANKPKNVDNFDKNGNIHCKTLSGSICVVDANNLLHPINIDVMNNPEKYLDFVDISSFESLHIFNEHVKKYSHIISGLSLLYSLLNRKIHPIMVFDKKTPLLKKNKRENKDKDNNKDNNKDNASEKKQRNEYLLQSSQFDEIMKLYDIFGVPIVKSYEEADSQCAALVLHHYRNYNDEIMCISNDSDAINFGCRRLITGYSKNKSMVTYYNIDDVMLNAMEKVNKIRADNSMELVNRFDILDLNNLTILCGTDYNDRIANVDPVEIMKLYALNDLDVHKVANKMVEMNLINNEKKDKFLEEWERTLEYYHTAPVIDPENINISIKKPDTKMIKELIKMVKINQPLIDDIMNILCTLSIYYNNHRKNIRENTGWDKFRSYQAHYCSNRRKSKYNVT